MNKVDVLDHGYVILQDTLGSDLTVVNAARASFQKRSEALSGADVKLMKYLVKHGHLSPFRHCVVQFELCAPLMVCRQLWKYIVGAENGEGHDPLLAWNEASYRYVSLDFQFYVPDANSWRGAPENKKQGSEGLVDLLNSEFLTEYLEDYIAQGMKYYEYAIKVGAAPEQARLFLLANGLYTTWYLTISLQGLLHLLIERLDDHAMYETRLYAGAMMDLTRPHFEQSFGLFSLKQDEGSDD